MTRHTESAPEPSRPLPPEYADAADDAAMPAGWWRRDLRVVAGILATLALVLIAVVTVSRAGHLGPDPAAEDVVRVYAEGLFWSVTAAGAAVTLYVLSRAGE